ncbi:AIPR family protein [Leucobacter allii]|uniref:AIPR family protein n=1 Tax=Leucobacter allii TaxID=2932247 RepID=A0ABY4FR55_9MICO|nr:AIPR family protein [Leucobacter allii]UOQ58765.1 AIPR family protein [Leucobacter allii]
MDPLLSGLFKKFKESNELGDVSDSDAFEMFAAKLVLRDDLTDQVTLSELLLDPSTPGIDVALLEVNGELVRDESDAREICSGTGKLVVALHFVQAKTSTNIHSPEILNMGDVVRRTLTGDSPTGYPKLERISKALQYMFEDHATKMQNPRPSVHLHFVTAASAQSVADASTQRRRATEEASLSDLTFLGEASVEVEGAVQLVEASRKKDAANEVDVVLKKSINLPSMPGVEQAILGLISLDQLLLLIRNDDGSLNERVFYDNVRGFQGSGNPVNDRIQETLKSSGNLLLPVLNNGVTVVASQYAPRPGDEVRLSGYQIVNGCQTSHCVHLVADELEDVSAVQLPIRVIVTDDDEVASNIILATNSQTAVNDSDLVALTLFQKNLEEFYQLDPLRTRLAYERRSGQYFDDPVPRTRVVAIREQMRALAGTFSNLPHLATRYPKDLYERIGEDIFADQHRYEPYVASAYAAYRLESAFRTSLDPKFKPLRYHILMAHKYLTLGGDSLALNDGRIVAQSEEIVESLRGSDYVGKLEDAARAILDFTGGEVPTSDRLKRAAFTSDLRGHLAREARS